MKLCKKLWLRYQISKSEKALLEEGMQEAKERGKNIQFGLEGRAVLNRNILETIYLPQNENGQIDISSLLSLGAESLPDEARRYVLYKKMLERMKR